MILSVSSYHANIDFESHVGVYVSHTSTAQLGVSEWFNSENAAARVDPIAHSLLFTSNSSHPSNITHFLSPCLMCFLTSKSPSKFSSSREGAIALSRTFLDAETEPRKSSSIFEAATSSTGSPCVAFYDGDTQDMGSTLDLPSHIYVVQYAYRPSPYLLVLYKLERGNVPAVGNGITHDNTIKTKNGGVFIGA